MENYNPKLRKTVIDIVNNQLRTNDPPEAQKTLDKLIAKGLNKKEAKELIGSVVLEHLYDLLKQRRVYNNRAYINDLKELSKRALQKMTD